MNDGSEYNEARAALGRLRDESPRNMKLPTRWSVVRLIELIPLRAYRARGFLWSDGLVVQYVTPQSTDTA